MACPTKERSHSFYLGESSSSVKKNDFFITRDERKVEILAIRGVRVGKEKVLSIAFWRIYHRRVKGKGRGRWNVENRGRRLKGWKIREGIHGNVGPPTS